MLKKTENFIAEGFIDKKIIDEYESIMSEQKKYIDNLKEQKFILENRIHELEKDRVNVLRVLYETQKNAETIISEANEKADKIVLAAIKRSENLSECKKKLREIESYITDIKCLIHEKEDKQPLILKNDIVQINVDKAALI